MAAIHLREVRRPKGSTPRSSLVAASQPITDPQRQLKGTVMGATRNDWQTEAWELYERVGELSYYVSWRSNSCSRCQLIASEIDPETGLPTGNIDENNAEAQRVVEYVRAIAGGPLGQAALIKRVVECLTVPGELWLVVLVRTAADPYTGQLVATEQWHAITSEEFKTKTGDTVEIELPDGKIHVFNPATDVMVRVWNPRARRARDATSPVRACLDSLREIERTSAKIRHAAKSRLMNAGVLFVPAQMSLPTGAAPVPEDMAEIPGYEPPVVTGVPAADQLAERLFQASVTSMEDENSQTSYIPLIASVDAEHLEKVQHLKFDNDITDVEIKTRIDAITRLAMGLDVSPERLLGMSKGNHWSAWAIGDEDVQLHIKPVMDLFCQAIYTEVLSVALRREGIDPTKYMLWYDASGLTSDPDLSEEAVQAHDRGAITSEALRRLLNVGEDSGYDLTTLEGCKVFAQDVVTKSPELIALYAPILGGEVAALDFPQPQAIGDGRAQPGQENEDESSGARNQREPDTEDDDQDAVTASMRTSDRADFLLAERFGVLRALELAGKRRVKVNDTALKARLRGLRPYDYHRVMGPVPESDIPRLTAGWDSDLEDEVITSLGVDSDAVRESVRRIVRRELTRQVIDAEVI